MSALAVGIDIGGTKTHAVVLDANRELVAEVRRPTEPGVPGLTTGLAALHGDLGRLVDLASIRSIGVGVPGIVGPEPGRVRRAVNVGLDDVELGRMVADIFRVPVAVENDVSAAAYGAWDWVGRPPSMSLISIGTGLGVGTILDGRLHRGSRGVAGEIGHLPVDLVAPRCRCGQHGCLELVLSGSGMARCWPVNGGHPAGHLAAAAEAGDPEAADVLGQLVHRLAWAIQLIAVTIDPEVVVLGGGVTSLGDALLDPLRAHLGDQVRESPFVGSLDLADRVRCLPAGHPAAAVGSAVHGINARDRTG